MLSMATLCSLPVSGSPDAVITLDPNTTLQTITGWEASTYAADWPGHTASYPLYMDELINLAADDLGINRVRLEIRSGTENPTDYWQMYVDGTIGEGDYIDNGYTIINDNADPFDIDMSKFKFSFVDHEIDAIVNPLRQRLATNGEELYVNLTYVDFEDTAFEHYDNPEEYAEFMLATFQHIQNKYGWVPDSVEVILEPDNSSWTGNHIGSVMVAAGDRLAANGFNPDFIAPSVAFIGNATSYFDGLIAVSGAENYISEFSYHRYGGASDTQVQNIVNRANTYGIDTSMIEHMGTPYQDLHKDLDQGQNSAWNGGFSLAGLSSDFDYYRIDDSNPSNPQVILNDKTKFYRQYFKFIRGGAVRIEATSNSGNFDPVAFINTDSKFVVVVKAETGGDIAINGLPEGTYGIKYTTSAQYNIDLLDQQINAGQTLNTNIPAAGVITIYAKTSSPPPIPTNTPTATPLPPEFDESAFLPIIGNELGGATTVEQTMSVCKKHR